MARTLANFPPPLFGDDAPTHLGPAPAGERSGPLPPWISESQGKPGKQIGRFILGPLRGRGGMGLVYQAYDPALRRIVALKLVAGRDPAHLPRFQQEARAQARVDHPNICKVYEVGHIEELPFIAMQYIEGDNLAVLGKDLSLPEKVRIITLAAEALDAAHHAGLIHRDIKPSNIMLERVDGGWRPYLTDFGLAKEEEGAALTLDGKVMGTPSYMAPEQAMGVTGRVDARADVYALGATFYFLLANRPPIQGGDAAQTLAALADGEVPSLRKLVPDLPLDLAVIVHKCLEKEPDRRYASARLLAEDLRRFHQGEPILARSPSLAYVMTKRVRKHWALSLAASVALLLGLGTVGWSLRLQWRARAQADLARQFGEQVKDLEFTLRMAHLLPRHDLSRDLARVRRAMDTIRVQMAAQKGLADAPGAYALGRGHLALGEYREARERLLQAWNLGARGPRVAEALGLTLGELYRRGLAEAAREPVGDARKAMEADLVRLYRDPALEFIRLAGDEPYLKGLLAYYEGRPADAAAFARSALAADPTSFEAFQLQGDAAQAEAETAFQHGDTTGAEAASERARRAYHQAMDIARSHPDVFLADARRCLLNMRLASRHSTGVDDRALTEALGHLDDALACDPASSGIQLAISQAWSLWGEELRHKGQSPLVANGRALVAAKRAAEGDAGPGPLIAMASLLRANAEYVRYHGGDPTPWIQEGAAIFRRAAELEPGNTTALRGHILLCFVAADDARRKGRDPRPTVEEGLALGQRLVVLQPGLASNHDWMGGLAGAQAEYLLDHAQDPGPWFTRALESFDRALAINPKDVSLLNNIAYYNARKAEWDLQSRRDPGPALARALDLARRGIAENRNPALVYGTFAFACRVQAQWDLQRGRSPLASLHEGLRACRKAEALDRGFYDNPLQAGLLGLVEARWRTAQRQDPGPVLAQALLDLRRARDLNSRHGWETELSYAAGLLQEAEARPGRAAALKAEARAVLAGAAQLDPGLALLKRLRAQAQGA